MSNLYFGITRYRYDICSEISDMACFSLNLKTAVDFNAEARCARDEMHLRRSRQVTRGHRPSPVGGASGCVVGLSERSEPEGPQGAARRKVTQSESEILWKSGKYENFSDGVNLHPLGVACMVL
jgi:hypothetical protein